MNITLRRAEASDGPVLAQVFCASVMQASVYDSAQRAAWAEAGQDPAIWASRAELGLLWLAETEGVPCGFVGREGDVLSYLYVAPDHARRGIGSVLVDHVERDAAGAGVSALTSFASHLARPVLEARGWQVIRPNRVERGGVWLENTVMRRELL